MLNKINLKKSKEAPKLLSVILDQGFMSITTLLTSVILARTFEKTQYADLVLLFSITIFILGFQSAIISKPYAINLNDFDKTEIPNYYQFNLNLKLVFTVLTILIFPILYYVSFEEKNTINFFLFLVYIISHTSFFFIRETFLSERRTKENLKYGLICSISIVIILLFIYIKKTDNIYYFLIPASIVYAVIAIFYLIKNYKVSKISKSQWKRFTFSNWNIGKWLVGSNLFFHISSSIYPWLLLYITTKDSIAIFGVLMSIASLVNPLLTALSSYLLPLFVKMNKNNDQIKGSVRKWTILFILMAITLVILGVFLGQFIITLLFGEKYNNLGLLVIYPFVVQSINICFQPFKIALNAIKRTDINFWILIPRSLISVILGYIFVSKFGLTGVFYTMIIETSLYQLTYFIVYQKIINSNLAYE